MSSQKLSSVPFWAQKIQSIIGQDPGNRGIKQLLKNPVHHYYRSVTTLYHAQAVTCISGFNIPPPETDGPLGSAAIVNYLVQHMGKHVYMVVDDGCERVQRAAVDLAMKQCKDEETRSKLHWCIFQVGNEKQNLDEAETLLHATDCLLSIEHLGLAKDGKKYSMRGLDKSMLNASTHHIFLKRDKSKHVAIAIGDGGNEMGFGLVRDEVVQNVPLGEVIGDTIPADYLIPCGVSNWGGHGLAAGLILHHLSNMERQSLLNLIFGSSNLEQLSNSDIEQHIFQYLISKAGMMDVDQELKVLDAILQEGSVDGITGKCERSIDNMPYEKEHAQVLNNLLQVCVEHILELLKDN